MKNKVFKIISTILFCVILISNISMTAFAFESNINTSNIHVKLSPASMKFINDATAHTSTLNDIELHINIKDSTLTHGNEIPVKVNLLWNIKNWNAELDGSALVYNDKNQIVLLGQAVGYNGKQIDDNFISLNFTYDIENKICIANVTYDINKPENSHIEFGENSEIFENAYNFLENKMQFEQYNENSLTKTVATYAIDSSLKEIFSNGSELAKMTMYVPKNLSSGGGVGVVSAKMYGNVSKATTYITKNVEGTAWSVVPSNCNVSFSADAGLRYITGTHSPTNNQVNKKVTIPLPKGLSYDFTYNVSSILSGVTSDETACHWNVYALNGISGIGNTDKSPGFKVSINQQGNKTGNIKVYGSANIGYHYLYIDATGHTNNTTWYSRTNGSGYINII